METIYIIIVNFNGFVDTCECIESIHTCRDKNIRIIVVDNASRVDEGEIIKKKYDDVIVLKSESNLGFSGGNNIGIRYAIEAGADYLLLLNNDTVVDRLFFEELYKNRSKSSVLTGIMYYYDIPDEVAFFSGVVDRNTGNSIMWKEIKSISCNTFITGACMFMHRGVIEKVGMLDEEYFMYCEDTDFCIRLIQNGYDLKTIEEAKYWHKIGRASSNESTFSNYYVSRNRIICIKKNRSYFNGSALIYTVLTRLIRAIQILPKDIKLCKSYILGIRDGLAGKTGKSERTY